MKPLRPFIYLAAFVLLVGLACSGGGNTPSQPVTQVPTQPVSNPPTTAPEPTQVPPTDVPPTEVVVTEPPAPEMQQFFTEEFDTPLSGWDILTVTGSDKADADKVKVEPRDGKLVWDFDSESLYYYLFYNGYTYDDVRLDLRADNRGRNNNSISLICRYDPEVGWYEFNIANSGVYDITYAEVKSNGDIAYNYISDGGSNAIKQGKDVNEYGISCKGNELTLYINGDEVKTVTEKKYALRSGQVGMSVSSFNVLPILIEMDWVKISEP